ncbi:hypothetical protein I350_01487 [Cryptococcus amylolentus CBS 6273]|uniref:Mitochondrial inner membrane protease subunit 2 n=1 Tax=Cryptococcus amylolentus CBS 6273 TaxID=1296118 RepID=A0A1E3KCR0_9TREE|nr:hypothetical protein I350_01487 [Cryptococcus amylolentus CBS 6273]
MFQARHFFKTKAARDAVLTRWMESRLLAWVPVGVFFTRHVYSLATVSGGSMQPTFNPELSSKPLDKDVVLLERWSVTPLPPLPPTPVRIPPGHCWVEGDSKYQTRDSNTYGPIPLGLVTARVSHILWPWIRAGEVLSSKGKSEGRVKRLGEEYRL